MFKFIGCILKLFLSFLLFVLIGIFVTFIIPYITAERYEDSETPHREFRVLVEMNDDSNNETSLHAIKWNEYIENINNYKAYRSPSEGRCYNCPLWCRAKNIQPGKQLIEIRYSQKYFFLYNRYYVTHGEIIPLYFRIADRSNAILGLLISLIMTPIALLCFGLVRKRIKNVNDKSNIALSANG